MFRHQCALLLLRTFEAGELAALCPENIRLPGLGVHGLVDKAVVCIQTPKSRRSLWRQQVATIADDRAIAWLSWLVQDTEAGSRNFPGGTLAFRRHMRVAMEALELSSSGFTPGGLRAGGTTDLFILGVEVARIRIMGRWKVMETLDHYVQEATAALALIRSQPSVVRNLSRLNVGAQRFASPQTTIGTFSSIVTSSHPNGPPSSRRGGARSGGGGS